MVSSNPAGQPSSIPSQSPFYHAFNAGRYDRQNLIQDYEGQFNCRLIVFIDAIVPQGVTPFEDLVYDADPAVDLHILLSSLGGDGETAIRLVRSAQSRCRELTVIIPDQAKSAATLLTLGAHHILMSPMSDLGPIDPQFRQGEDLVAAKDIIAAVDDAAQRIQEAPDTYPLHVSLLSDVSSLMVQQARSAVAGTNDLLREALGSNSDRSDEEVAGLHSKLVGPLISQPMTHTALFGVRDAIEAGLPAEEADLKGEQWQMLWRLWTKYYALLSSGEIRGIYEGLRVSFPLSPYH